MTAPQIAIAVPVRNEVERLPHLLSALAGQSDAPPFRLILFFDNCDDGSEALVAASTPRLPFEVVSDCRYSNGPPSAGLARRRAMQLAIAVAPDGVLMTTDADSRPAHDWVAANLAGLRHADVVAGRIIRDPATVAPVQARLEAYYDSLHALRRRLDPVAYEADDTHHWTSAASMAVSTRTYRAIGGFAPLASGEDAALADSAARLGFLVRRDAAARVVTSDRRSGRVSGGYAAQLAASDTSDRLPVVAHPEDEAWRYAMHAAARQMLDTSDHARLAASLRLPPDEVAAVAAECRNGEAFAARIVGAPPAGMRHVTLAHAELLLTAVEQAGLEGAA